MIKELRCLWTDFISFIKKDYNLFSYLYTFIVIVVSITLVYTTHIGGELGKGLAPFSNKIVNNFLLFSFLYFIILIPILIKTKKTKLLSFSFILKALVFLMAMSFADIFSWRSYISFDNFSRTENRFIWNILWWSKNVIFVLPIIIIMKLLFDKKIPGLYGLCRGKQHIKAYLWLYIIIIPLLIAVSFTPQFRSYYPIGKVWNYDGLFGNSMIINILIFELFYIVNFIMVELIFRGTFVIGLGKNILHHAVLPMVTIYVALHFGKPIFETISAIFGGFFLGAIAYQSKHIWGGVFIHIGIAVFIEIIRITEYYFFGF